MVAGNDLLKRRLLVRLEQLTAPLYRGLLACIDVSHSNITARWSSERDWPTPEEWETLRAADTLDEILCYPCSSQSKDAWL